MRALNRLTLSEMAFTPPRTGYQGAGATLWFGTLAVLHGILAVLVVGAGVAVVVLVDVWSPWAILLGPFILQFGAGLVGNAMVAGIGAARSSSRRYAARPVLAVSVRTVDLVEVDTTWARVWVFVMTFGWVPPWRVLVASLLVGVAIWTTWPLRSGQWWWAPLTLACVAAAVGLVAHSARWIRGRQRQRRG